MLQPPRLGGGAPSSQCSPRWIFCTNFGGMRASPGLVLLAVGSGVAVHKPDVPSKALDPPGGTVALEENVGRNDGANGPAVHGRASR